MIRQIYVFGLISCVCCANDFSLFRRTSDINGNSCTQELFVKPCNMLTKCATLCKTSPGCERFFFMHGSNSCVGCLSLQIQTTFSSESIGYVLGVTMTYLGCYLDSIPRVLNGTAISFNTLTNEMCWQFCRDKGFIYAGTQNHGECYCGNSYDESGKRPESECSATCFGDPTQTCGAEWKNSIYT